MYLFSSLKWPNCTYFYTFWRTYNKDNRCSTTECLTICLIRLMNESYRIPTLFYPVPNSGVPHLCTVKWKRGFLPSWHGAACVQPIHPFVRSPAWLSTTALRKQWALHIYLLLLLLLLPLFPSSPLLHCRVM